MSDKDVRVTTKETTNMTRTEKELYSSLAKQGNEVLDFILTEITIGGKVTIVFDKAVEMPENVNEWSNYGVGSDVIEVVYQPSKETELSLIEQEIEPITMNWAVDSSNE